MTKSRENHPAWSELVDLFFLLSSFFLTRMASQRRSQRATRRPARLAEEQDRPDVDQRGRANRGRRREQPVGEQLLMEDINRIDDDEGVAEDTVAEEEGDGEGGGEDEGRVGRPPANHGPERVNLLPYIDPPLLTGLPCPPIVDADGWASIDSWGAWDCAVTHNLLMEEVPGQFRNAFSTALMLKPELLSGFSSSPRLCSGNPREAAEGVRVLVRSAGDLRRSARETGLNSLRC